MEWLRMEGTSGSHLVQHCRSSRNTQSSLPSTISRWLLNSKKISKKRDSAFLGNLFHCSVNSTWNNTDSCTPRTPSPCRQQAECSTSEYNPLCSSIAVAWSSCIFQQWKQISSDTTERVMIYKVSQNAPDIRCAKYRFSTSSKRLGEKRRMTFPIKIDNDIPVLKKRALKGPVTMWIFFILAWKNSHQESYVQWTDMKGSREAGSLNPLESVPKGWSPADK